MDLAIGGISVAALIIGVVEAAKEFGVEGKSSRALALGLGVFFVGSAQAISQGIVPVEAVPYVELGVTAIAGGLAAMGYYDLGKRFSRRG